MREFYNWFESVLKTPPGSLNEEIIKKASFFFKEDARLSSSERLALYHRQVWHRFFQQIKAEYSTLVKVVGSSLFEREIIEPFLSDLWPKDRSLVNLGRDLPLWLIKTYKKVDREMVLGLAQVDWAYQRLHFQKQVLLHLKGDFFSLKEILNPSGVEKGFKNPSVSLNQDTFSLGKERWYLLRRNGWKVIRPEYAEKIQKNIEKTGGFLGVVQQ